MEEDKFVTLAIHTIEKATILKKVLEKANIEVQTSTVEGDSQTSKGIRIRIKESDLSQALNVVESRQLFSYDEEETHRIDDGRKRILIPVDFSDYSIKACSIAFKMAHEMNAKVKILHVYFNPYYPTALPIADAFAYQGKEEKEFQNVINKVKDNIQKLCSTIDQKIVSGEFPSINYSYVLREGLPEEEIVGFTKEYKPALIVMGTRGKDQKDADLIGSVTAEVIEMTKTPIITVPEETHFHDFKDIKHVAFLTNFSERDLISFEQLTQLLTTDNLRITILHIDEKKRGTWTQIQLEGIKAYLSKQYSGLDIGYKIINSDDMLISLDDYMKDEKIDILALTTSKRNVFARMFYPSISRKMLFHSDTPLFVLRG